VPPAIDPRAALGQAVRELRGEMTQEALALRVGKAQGWISRLEAGEINVTVRNLWRLAAGLGVTVADLVAAAECVQLRKKGPSTR
jgi:transcriptional regulator with XRE-family HTH domain